MAPSRGGRVAPAAVGPAIVIALLLTCFASSQQAQAVVPAPDGGYPGGNTAEGQAALFSLSSARTILPLACSHSWSNVNGSFNTAIGAGALLLNVAEQNTATGAGALLNNTSGVFNTANGAFALLHAEQRPAPVRQHWQHTARLAPFSANTTR